MVLYIKFCTYNYFVRNIFILFFSWHCLFTQRDIFLFYEIWWFSWHSTWPLRRKFPRCPLSATIHQLNHNFTKYRPHENNLQARKSTEKMCGKTILYRITTTAQCTMYRIFYKYTVEWKGADGNKFNVINFNKLFSNTVNLITKTTFVFFNFTGLVGETLSGDSFMYCSYQATLLFDFLYYLCRFLKNATTYIWQIFKFKHLPCQSNNKCIEYVIWF
jgi:hypothetical protein